MSSTPPPYLNAVARLERYDRNGRSAGAGTCFFVRARHRYDPERESLFLVTNAHVIDKDFGHLDLLVPPMGGGLVRSFTVTAEIGDEAATWEVDREQDLAVLRLDGEHLPTDEIRRRSFDVDDDALALRELRRLRTGPGDEAFLVGFILPHERGDRQCPGLRLATISRLTSRVESTPSFMLEGVTLPGNSGSPVVLRRDRTNGGDAASGATGKLIGTLCNHWHLASVIRTDENGVPVEARENVGRFQISPVDVLRRLVDKVAADIYRIEVIEPTLRRWCGWLWGRRHPD